VTTVTVSGSRLRVVRLSSEHIKRFDPLKKRNLNLCLPLSIAGPIPRICVRRLLQITVSPGLEFVERSELDFFWKSVSSPA
jgi:hypothetical protein